jgi:site-specific DNA-adenine methylase
LARRIIARFPPHETYLEPCAGGAAVLLNKPRARTEVLTDLDPTIIKMLRALRDNPKQVLGVCSKLEYNQSWLDRVQRGLDVHHKLPDALVSACMIYRHHATRSGSGKGKLATWTRHAVGWYTPAAS